MAFLNKLPHLFKVQCVNLSRKKLGSRYQLEIFSKFRNTLKEMSSNILIEPNNISKETWESIRNVMIECNNNIQSDIDTLMLNFFYAENCLDAGINYYKFLEDNGYNPSMVIMSEYLKLYQLRITDENKIQIANICKKMMDHCKFLPPFAAEAIVLNLCDIDEFEKAAMVLKNFETHDEKILHRAYNALIECLVKNNSTLVNEYIVLAMQKRMWIYDNVYEKYLQYCLQERNTFNEKIETLFSLWRKYGIKPVKAVVQHFINACNEAGWSAQFTNITNLQCKICREIVQEIKLTKEEFKRLHEVIIKNVITDNAYKTSDPIELNNFIKFIESHKPYDYVIDGLNLFAAILKSKIQFKSFLTQLQNSNKKVLFIAKRHLKKVISQMDVTDLADFFFVEDLTKDDALILYAVFSSGDNTNIISMDLMRQHKFTFNDAELEVLFRRWQQVHQFTIHKHSSNLIRLHELVPIDSYPVKKNNCWHIPYHARFTMQVMKTHACNNDWACFNMCT